MPLFTRTDQKFLSFALSSLWKLMPGLAGLSCRSNAVVLTAFCSSPVSRARLSVKVSAIRSSIMPRCLEKEETPPLQLDALSAVLVGAWLLREARLLHH